MVGTRRILRRPYSPSSPLTIFGSYSSRRRRARAWSTVTRKASLVAPVQARSCCADRAVLTTAAVFELALKRSQAAQVRLSFAVPAIVIMVPLFGRPEIARELYISGTTVKPT